MMQTHLTGRDYWRSLEQLADTPELREQLAQEFPGYNPDELLSMSRRNFLKLMGASMALAGLTMTGCRRWPEEKVAPYTQRPEYLVPGQARYYATVMSVGESVMGFLVKSHDQRPIKIEGNPSHPFSLGATDGFAQASVLDLYDPQRARYVTQRSSGEPTRRTWSDISGVLESNLAAMPQGQGFAILCESTTSPTVARLKAAVLQRYPRVQWHEYEPLSRDNEIHGSKLAFGQALRAHLQLDKAKVVACFDADPLGSHPAKLLHARQWAKSRQPEHGMSRIYVAESAYSTTGSIADHRHPTPSSNMPALLAALAQRAGITGVGTSGSLNGSTEFIEQLAKDLLANRGESIVVAGPQQPTQVHALVHAINAALDNNNRTITFTQEPAGDRPSHAQSIRSLTEAMNAGSVDSLLILGGNPAYTAPADLRFADALSRVKTTLHLSNYIDETSMLCEWRLPRAHFLECWGDARAWDGTLSVQQPLIHPLFEGRSIDQLLAMLAGEQAYEGDELVKTTFASVLPAMDREKAWRRVLHDGLLTGSAFANLTAPAPAVPPALPAMSSDMGMELTFTRSTSTFDGRFAHNGWLQETPDALTTLTWDNAALISVGDAKKLGIATGDVIKLTTGIGDLELAAYVMPGQAVGSVSVALGYGRSEGSSIAAGVGFNAYSLRGSDTQHIARVRVEKTSRKYPLALSQHHHLIDDVGWKGREKRVGEKGHSGKIIREASYEQYRKHPSVMHRDEHGNVNLQLFEPPHQYNEPNAWGMAVDLNNCIGCNSCLVACQAENNVPIVGKDQVLVQREMHWLRIDRYFKGSPDDESPDVVFQPMMCVHCENAPCEEVCPVAATVHDSEGLNTQIYNRCIGTRYCSNNCPYKVRRFNYFDYHSKDPRGGAVPWLGIPDEQQNSVIDDIKKLLFNPDVTVRMRGVMEKCTYCVQRVQAGKIAARLEDRDLRDGDVVTACEQACPTQAIVFGNLNDPDSRVRKLHENSRAYSVLEELNTRPRTKYLGKLRNPAGNAAAHETTEHHT